MPNFPLHRCLRRTRPAQTSFRRSARPRLDILEARDVPSTTMVRTPYSPYAAPAVVASMPQSDFPQQLTYAIDNTAAGESVTAWAHVPSTGEQIPGIGVYFTQMTHLGQASSPVFVEGFDFDASDHFTSGITGYVDVACRPDGGFAVAYVRSVGHFPDPAGPADWTSQTLVVRIFDANGTELVGPDSFDTIVDNDPYDNIHLAIVKPQVGMDNLGGVTGAWQVVTDVDPAAPAHGSTTVNLYESRWRYDDITGVPYLTAKQTVASSFLDKGDGSFSQYDGDLILSHDVATNASGKSVVAWDRQIITETHLYSAYLTLDAIYRRRIDEYGTILTDSNPDDMIVSQNADAWEAYPVPKVAINDAGAHAVVWTYAPDYSVPQSQLPAQRGIYTRFYDWNAPLADEVLVASSPNSDGRPTYPSPPHFYVGHGDHPIAMNNGGNVLVGYYDDSSDTSVTPYRLRGQLFNLNGTRIGDRFSFVEANSGYAQQSVGPDQFRLAMDANAHISAAWGNPESVPNTAVTVLAQRFVRVEFDVQHGEIQRSTVQYVDFAFNPGMVDVAALLNPGRVQLIQYPLNGSQQGTPVSLAGVLSYAGNTLTMNFGTMGLSDGYYKALLDLDGDGVYEMVRTFYRKYGDFSGTGLNNNPWIHFYLND
jgi:hypothetical protein